MPDKGLPDRWRKGTLADLAGLSPDNWDPTSGGSIRYLDIASITRPGRVSALPEIAAAAAPSRARRRGCKGDVLVSTVRPYLKAFTRLGDIPANLVISTGFAVLHPREAADGAFLYQQVLTDDFQRHLEPRMTGTGYPAVRPRDVVEYPILIPPPVERARIAEVLGAIDAAIEKTEAVIAATERLRSALLAELLTRGVPGWHTEWKQVSGIGTMPACWDVVRLGDVFEVQLGKMLSPKAKTGRNSRPYLTNRNVRWGDFDLTDVPEMDFDDREFEKFKLRNGDLLVCEGGEVGRAAVWDGATEGCCYQKALHRVRPRGHDSTLFLQAFLTQAANIGYLDDFSETTSIAHLTAERLNRMRMPRPGTREQEVVVETLLRVRDEALSEQRILLGLQDLKATTATALLSGRVRVTGGDV